MFLPSFLSGVNFFFYLDLYLFLSLLYGMQVYSFAAIPAICLLCYKLYADLGTVGLFNNRTAIARAIFGLLLVIYNPK